jgi:hypothetical protein
MRSHFERWTTGESAPLMWGRRSRSNETGRLGRRPLFVIIAKKWLRVVRRNAGRQIIISWVCPKQYLALRIKAAFSRYIAGVMPAGIVELAVPTASLPPLAPGDVIAILAVGISRFPGRTKDALGGMAWTGDYVPGHRGSCQHRRKGRRNANQPEFRHAFVPSVPPVQITKYG